MAGRTCESRINILRDECQEFFDLIYKVLSTNKVTNEDKMKLNLIEHEGKDWLLSFQKQNQILMNSRKFQEEIDIQLYSLFDELNVIKTRLYAISNKYRLCSEKA